MNARLLWCIISTFLFASISAEAQSPALRAVECERILFEGASPADANAALLERSESLVSLERWADALESLSRLRLYALSADDFPRVAYLKMLCKLRTGDCEGAYADLVQGAAEGWWPSPGERPKAKSPVTAILLSILPPAGHMYVHSADGIPVALASYASAAFTVWQALEGNWITVVLGGGSLLSMNYMRRNLQRVPFLAEEYNAAALEEYLEKELSLLEF